MTKVYPFIPFSRDTYAAEEMIERSKEYYERLDKRRTVRDFADTPVPREVISNVIMAGSSAPSGAHKQPWTFCAVGDPDIKKKIRAAAEEEEYENYHGRMPKEWLDDLAPLQTDHHKEFLEVAPWLIVVFKRSYELVNGEKKHNYYVSESVGLACGFMLTAIHEAGLIALTHTPSPMDFLTNILDRPQNEKPYLLIPVGYPADGATVPDIHRKPESEVAIFYE